MRVFLTGGTGFIGLAVTALLLEQGAEVTSVSDRLPADWARAALPGAVAFQICDIRDGAQVAALMAEARPDIVFHAAAATPDDARERSGPSADIIAVNVGGTANVVEAAARIGVPRVVALSSGAVYGRTMDEVAALAETTPCHPKALYAQTKLAAERIAHRLGEVHGVGIITPRLGAAWGLWEHRTVDRQTPSPAFQIIEAIRAGVMPGIAGGAAVPMIDASTAADALVKLMQADHAPGVVNVGGEQPVPLATFTQIAAQVFDGVDKGDVSGPEVALFGPGRPPMDLGLLRQTIGPLAKIPLEAQIRGYAAWLDHGNNAATMR